MAQTKDQGITVTKTEDISEWYEQVCLKAQLGDFGDIKGTMIIRPKGFYIWERIQANLNAFMQTIGVQNASFPLFIPEKFFKKEASHAKGFAPELAWVQTADMDENEEKAIIRPTSETVIIDHARKILRNYRQLPIKLNQWCNVVRWESKQTKLFLRSREFLWQEGHCFYETNEECQTDVEAVLDAYVSMAKDVLAIPSIPGEKTICERFPGADKTYTFEGLMPDGKALQMGTTHNLGQNFTKAFGVEFMGSDEQNHTPFYNSWGVATRLLGAVIMTHSDDKGLILPPNCVREKVAIVPLKKKDSPDSFDSYIDSLHEGLKTFGAVVDDSNKSLGFTLSEHELQGTPIVAIVGGQEMENNQVTLKLRDTGEKITVSRDLVVEEVATQLISMHDRLYTKAKEFLESRIVEVSTKEEFASAIAENKIVLCSSVDSPELETEINNEFAGVGSRCIKMDSTPGTCIFTGKQTPHQIYYGRSY